MNRGALRNDVKLRLKLPVASDPLLDDPTINECIRLALLDISAEHDWPWLLTSATATFSTVTGQAAYPTDCVKIRELFVGTGNTARRAKRVGLAEWLDNRTIGRYVWTDIGGQMAMTPIPTTVPTATVYYIRLEPVILLDATVPLLPEAYHSFLIARASYHANMRRRYTDDAAIDSNEYESGLKRMKDATWSKTGPRQVRTAGRFDDTAVW